jgi:hypothetical protein
MTQKYYIEDPTLIINYILDKYPVISPHKLQILLFSFCWQYTTNFKDAPDQPQFFTKLKFKTDPFTTVIPGLEKDLHSGKYKPETADVIRTSDPDFLNAINEAIHTFIHIPDFKATQFLYSIPVWKNALKQGYNKPFDQEQFLED